VREKEGQEAWHGILGSKERGNGKKKGRSNVKKEPNQNGTMKKA
jgi:hypothetical protein